jgi:phage baseplate assembly protein gpV
LCGTGLLLVQPEGKAKPKIGPVKENGALLARLQAFLPALKESNDALPSTSEDGEAMELPEQYDGKHVELDLACGVFDLNNEDAVQAAERSIHVPEPVVDSDTSDEDIHPGIEEIK